MDILELAVRARVPYVHVTTDDLANIERVLSFIAEGDISAHTGNDEEGFATEVVVTNCDDPKPGLYLKAKHKKCCVVFVNTKKHVMHLGCGTMLPPKALMKLWVKEHGFGETDEVLDCLGGLTLKEAYDLLRMTQKEYSALTAKNINTVRQSYVQRLKGLTLVALDDQFYQVPSELEAWLKINTPLFVHPKVKRLIPRGLLFDGPPGTGKTMAAKHIATTFGVPLYRLDIGGLKGKYVGDSEGALAAALNQLDQSAPCVVLLDEVEKALARTNGSSGDHVGVSMLGSLLWWLQEHKSRVLTVMTTNAVMSLPPELHREGRIDQTLVLDGLRTINDRMAFAARVLLDLDSQEDLGLTEAVKSDILNAVEGEMKVVASKNNGKVAQSLVATAVENELKKVLAS